jgi:hypothetical protein
MNLSIILGVVHQNKLWIADSSGAECFDPVASSWTSWPAYPTVVKYGSCLTIWQNTLMLIDFFNLQTFDLTSNTWTTKAIFPPQVIVYPACLTLPNNKILVVGTLGLPVLYDPTNDVWTELPPTYNAQGKVSLVQSPLSRRVFLLGGNGTSTVAHEFNQNTNTWSSVAGGPVRTTNNAGYASAVFVPANPFNKMPGGCNGII